jgi:hypothetical protein
MEDSMNVSKARNSHEHIKNFSENYRQSGHVSSIRFSSPNLYSWNLLLGYFTTLSQLQIVKYVNDTQYEDGARRGRSYGTVRIANLVKTGIHFYCNFFFQCHHMSLMDCVVSPPGCGRSVTDFEVGTPMRRSYVVPMRWMVIYEYEVPGGALNLIYTKLPRPWSPWGSSPSRTTPHGRPGNRPRDLMISSQKL